MTHDGQDGSLDETQPPVTTQWSAAMDRPTEETGELMPPFVPGRSQDPWQVEPVLETADAVVDTTELDTAGTEPTDATVEADPVATPEAEWELEAPEWEMAEGPEVEQAVPEGEMEGPEVEPGAPQAEMEAAEAEMEAPEVELEALDEAEGSVVQDAEIGLDGAQVVADRLESLAARIRAEGYGAAEREMASSDQLTSLIAGVVAGYLAGLRE